MTGSPWTSETYFGLWAFSIMFGDILYVVASSSFRATFSRRSDPANAVAAGLVLGVVVGIITALLAPARVFAPPPKAGVSLVLAPIVGALFMLPMRALARIWVQRAQYLPTWYAGAGVGLGAAIARLVWIRVFESGA